jgi:hypothetical protein
LKTLKLSIDSHSLPDLKQCSENKPKRGPITEDESDEFFSRINSEVEEELEPLENDGLPIIEYYANILNCNTTPPLILVELTKSLNSKSNQNSQENISLFDIKANIEHFEVYLDRYMISRIITNLLLLKNYRKVYQNTNKLAGQSDYSDSMNRQESLEISTSLSKRRSSATKSDNDTTSNLNSINIRLSGLSTYVPDTLAFERDK